MKHQTEEIPGRIKTVSRRRFLRVAGTVILVAGGGCQMVTGNAKPAGPSLSETLANAKYPPSEGYILVDTEKCQGCVSCMLSCSLVHEGVESQSLSRIQIIQDAFESYPDDLTIEQCRQCVDPKCVEKCPEQALGVNAEFGNVRMVDRSKCVGCETCIEACPFTPSRPVMTEDKDYEGELIARKCDLCANTPYHWDAAGGGPDGKQACVEVCPVEAIKFSTKIPVQVGEEGYKVNLRDWKWAQLGYPRD